MNNECYFEQMGYLDVWWYCVGKKRIGCQLCPAMYSTVNNLRIHIKDQHSGKSPAKCHVCHSVFKNPSSLRTHFRRYHT